MIKTYGNAIEGVMTPHPSPSKEAGGLMTESALCPNCATGKNYFLLECPNGTLVYRTNDLSGLTRVYLDGGYITVNNKQWNIGDCLCNKIAFVHYRLLGGNKKNKSKKVNKKTNPPKQHQHQPSPKRKNRRKHKPGQPKQENMGKAVPMVGVKMTKDGMTKSTRIRKTRQGEHTINYAVTQQHLPSDAKRQMSEYTFDITGGYQNSTVFAFDRTFSQYSLFLAANSIPELTETMINHEQFSNIGLEFDFRLLNDFTGELVFTSVDSPDKLPKQDLQAWIDQRLATNNGETKVIDLEKVKFRRFRISLPLMGGIRDFSDKVATVMCYYRTSTFIKQIAVSGMSGATNDNLTVHLGPLAKVTTKYIYNEVWRTPAKRVLAYDVQEYEFSWDNIAMTVNTIGGHRVSSTPMFALSAPSDARPITTTILPGALPHDTVGDQSAAVDLLVSVVSMFSDGIGENTRTILNVVADIAGVVVPGVMALVDGTATLIDAVVGEDIRNSINSQTGVSTLLDGTTPKQAESSGVSSTATVSQGAQHLTRTTAFQDIMNAMGPNPNMNAYWQALLNLQVQHSFYPRCSTHGIDNSAPDQSFTMSMGIPTTADGLIYNLLTNDLAPLVTASADPVMFIPPLYLTGFKRSVSQKQMAREKEYIPKPEFRIFGVYVAKSTLRLGTCLFEDEAAPIFSEFVFPDVATMCSILGFPDTSYPEWAIASLPSTDTDLGEALNVNFTFRCRGSLTDNLPTMSDHPPMFPWGQTNMTLTWADTGTTGGWAHLVGNLPRNHKVRHSSGQHELCFHYDLSEVTNRHIFEIRFHDKAPTTPVGPAEYLQALSGFSVENSNDIPPPPEPIILDSPTYKAQSSTQLNGANGEYTGKDDVAPLIWVGSNILFTLCWDAVIKGGQAMINFFSATQPTQQKYDHNSSQDGTTTFVVSGEEEEEDLLVNFIKFIVIQLNGTHGEVTCEDDMENRITTMCQQKWDDAEFKKVLWLMRAVDESVSAKYLLKLGFKLTRRENSEEFKLAKFTHYRIRADQLNAPIKAVPTNHSMRKAVENFFLFAGVNKNGCLIISRTDPKDYWIDAYNFGTIKAKCFEKWLTQNKGLNQYPDKTFKQIMARNIAERKYFYSWTDLTTKTRELIQGWHTDWKDQDVKLPEFKSMMELKKQFSLPKLKNALDQVITAPPGMIRAALKVKAGGKSITPHKINYKDRSFKVSTSLLSDMLGNYSLNINIVLNTIYLSDIDMVDGVQRGITPDQLIKVKKVQKKKFEIIREQKKFTPVLKEVQFKPWPKKTQPRNLELKVFTKMSHNFKVGQMTYKIHTKNIARAIAAERNFDANLNYGLVGDLQQFYWELYSPGKAPIINTPRWRNGIVENMIFDSVPDEFKSVPDYELRKHNINVGVMPISESEVGSSVDYSGKPVMIFLFTGSLPQNINPPVFQFSSHGEVTEEDDMAAQIGFEIDIHSESVHPMVGGWEPECAITTEQDMKIKDLIPRRLKTRPIELYIDGNWTTNKNLRLSQVGGSKQQWVIKYHKRSIKLNLVMMDGQKLLIKHIADTPYRGGGRLYEVAHKVAVGYPATHIPLEGVEYLVRREPQLNGTHGEATNEDDMGQQVSTMSTPRPSAFGLPKPVSMPSPKEEFGGLERSIINIHDRSLEVMQYISDKYEAMVSTWEAVPELIIHAWQRLCDIFSLGNLIDFMLSLICPSAKAIWKTTKYLFHLFWTACVLVVEKVFNEEAIAETLNMLGPDADGDSPSDLLTLQQYEEAIQSLRVTTAVYDQVSYTYLSGNSYRYPFVKSKKKSLQFYHDKPSNFKRFYLPPPPDPTGIILIDHFGKDYEANDDVQKTRSSQLMVEYDRIVRWNNTREISPIHWYYDNAPPPDIDYPTEWTDENIEQYHNIRRIVIYTIFIKYIKFCAQRGRINSDEQEYSVHVELESSIPVGTVRMSDPPQGFDHIVKFFPTVKKSDWHFTQVRKVDNPNNNIITIKLSKDGGGGRKKKTEEWRICTEKTNCRNKECKNDHYKINIDKFPKKDYCFSLFATTHKKTTCKRRHLIPIEIDEFIAKEYIRHLSPDLESIERREELRNEIEADNQASQIVLEAIKNRPEIKKQKKPRLNPNLSTNPENIRKQLELPPKCQPKTKVIAGPQTKEQFEETFKMSRDDTGTANMLMINPAQLRILEHVCTELAAVTKAETDPCEACGNMHKNESCTHIRHMGEFEAQYFPKITSVGAFEGIMWNAWWIFNRKYFPEELKKFGWKMFLVNTLAFFYPFAKSEKLSLLLVGQQGIDLRHDHLGEIEPIEHETAPGDRHMVNAKRNIRSRYAEVQIKLFDSYHSFRKNIIIDVGLINLANELTAVGTTNPIAAYLALFRGCRYLVSHPSTLDYLSYTALIGQYQHGMHHGTDAPQRVVHWGQNGLPEFDEAVCPGLKIRLRSEAIKWQPVFISYFDFENAAMVYKDLNSISSQLGFLVRNGQITQKIQINRELAKKIGDHLISRMCHLLPRSGPMESYDYVWSLNKTLREKLAMMKEMSISDWMIRIIPGACEEVIASYFAKREGYPTMKATRAIFNPGMLNKPREGLWMRALEKIITATNLWMIKNVPAEQRMEFMLDHKTGMITILFDGKRYEVSQIPEITSQITKRLTAMIFDEDVAQVFHEFDHGPHTLRTQNFEYKYKRTGRGSGKQSTAIKNFIENVGPTIYLMEVVLSREDSSTVCEGDDGTNAITDWSKPRAFTKAICHEFYASIGRIVECTENAPFCQVIPEDPHPTDRRPTLLIDPIKTLVNFGNLNMKYSEATMRVIKGLYRGKALSILHLSNGAPIVAKFCFRVLELTEGYKPRYDEDFRNMYSIRFSEMIDENPSYIEPSDGSRSVVEIQWNIPVSDQIDAEEEMSLVELGVFNIQSLTQHIPESYRTNYYQQVVRYKQDKCNKLTKEHLEFVCQVFNLCGKYGIPMSWRVLNVEYYTALCFTKTWFEGTAQEKYSLTKLRRAQICAPNFNECCDRAYKHFLSLVLLSQHDEDSAKIEKLKQLMAEGTRHSITRAETEERKPLDDVDDDDSSDVNVEVVPVLRVETRDSTSFETSSSSSGVPTEPPSQAQGTLTREPEKDLMTAFSRLPK